MPARLIRLGDAENHALVYPEQGFQLYGLRLSPDGNPVDAVSAPPAPPEPADRRYGNPILFPVAGVSNGSQPDSWDHEGRALPMPQHGWARNTYWDVERGDGRSVTGLFSSRASSVRHAFPFDFELRATYSLQAGALALDAEVRNRGAAPFPYALGFHPYLRAPLAGGPRSRCLIDLPAGTRLRSADGWRTIERAAAPARAVAADDPELPSSIVLADGGAAALEVRDEAAGLALRVSVEGSEQPFPVWVIWTAGPDAPYVCLEPWTDAPNALNRAGTRRLVPGAADRFRMTISARRL